MKKILLLLISILFVSCERKPDLYINGYPYYINKKCIKSETKTEIKAHYGYNYFNGKYQYHIGPKTETKCIEYRIDTIKLNKQ